MTDNLYRRLHSEGLLSDESLNRLEQKQPEKLFSVHWEVRTLLYAGILLLTSGLGLLIYENIDTIGHGFVLILIASISAGCFFYCIKNKSPFNTGKVPAPNASFDYILLLGSITFVTFVGYLQFEYKVFGLHYGLATLIPMLMLFFIAYSFDHLGILSMAIVNFALWMGISVTPRSLLVNSDFKSGTLIYTYLVFALVLLVIAYGTQYFNFKKHFKFSYQHYGIHVAYISLLAGYFHYYEYRVAIAFMLGMLMLSIIVYRDAFANKSFYFLLLMVLYSYIAVSSLVVRLGAEANTAVIELVFLYFVGSGIGLIFLLIYLNKMIKAA